MTILPQLERDLFNAAEQRLPAATDEASGRAGGVRRGTVAGARWPRLRRRLRAVMAPLPALVSVLVAVAVAAVALTALGHRRVPAGATSARSVQASRRQLIAAFGVLRRPQTKADLDPTFVPGFLGTVPERFAQHHMRPPAGFERALARWGYPKLDRPLVRVIHIAPWHAKLAFEPATFQPSASTTYRTEGLDIELWTGLARTIPPSTDDGTGPRPTSVGDLLAHGLALIGGPRGRDGVFVVPDEVARVTLGPIRLIRPPAKVDSSKFGTLTAAVHDNVAAFQIPVLTATSRRTYSGLFGVSAVAQAIWFGPTGNVIKRTTTDLDVIIKVVGKGPLPVLSRAGTLQRRFCRQNPHAC